MKNSVLLFGFLVVLGIVSLSLVLVSSYLSCVDALNILALLPSSQFWFLFLLFVGIATLTVGILGIGRQLVKNRRGLFTVLVALLAPLLVFASMFVAITMIMYNAPMFPLRSEITHVSVVDTSPLILSLNVKAITSRDSRIEGAIVLNSDDDIVAEIYEQKWVEGLALAVLPAGSEITLTLDFNTTLPSGNYLVRLTCWHNDHGSSAFAIP